MLFVIIIRCYSRPRAKVNFEELARCTDDFNGAMLKAVCVEAVSVQVSSIFCMKKANAFYLAVCSTEVFFVMPPQHLF